MQLHTSSGMLAGDKALMQVAVQRVVDFETHTAVQLHTSDGGMTFGET